MCGSGCAEELSRAKEEAQRERAEALEAKTEFDREAAEAVNNTTQHNRAATPTCPHDSPDGANGWVVAVGCPPRF